MSKEKNEEKNEIDQINLEAQIETKKIQAHKQEMEDAKISLSDIDADPQYNYRQSGYEEGSPRLNSLISAIKSYGALINPLTVTRTPEGSDSTKPYILLAGFKRYYALQAIAKETGDSSWITDVSCKIDVSDNWGQKLLVQLMENEARSNCDPLEVAGGLVYAMKECNLSIDAIAQMTGKHVETVRQYIKLMDLPPKTQALLELGQEGGGIGLSQAKLLCNSRIPKDKIDQLAVLACGVTYNNFKSRLDELYQSDEDKKKEATGEEGADNESAANGDGPQREQSVLRSKTVETQVIPWLESARKDLVAAEKAEEAAKVAAYEEAYKYILNPKEDHPIAKLLAPYKAQFEKEKAEAIEADKAEKLHKNFIGSCLKIVRDTINIPLEEGQTKPTIAMGLANVKNSVMALIAEDKLPIKLQDDLNQEDAVTHLLGEVEKAYIADKQKRSEAAAKRKADKEAAEKAEKEKADKEAAATTEGGDSESGKTEAAEAATA